MANYPDSRTDHWDIFILQRPQIPHYKTNSMERNATGETCVTASIAGCKPTANLQNPQQSLVLSWMKESSILQRRMTEKRVKP